MGLRLLGMHMRIGTGMGTGRLKGTASFYVLSAKGTRNRDPYSGYFFAARCPRPQVPCW